MSVPTSIETDPDHGPFADNDPNSDLTDDPCPHEKLHGGYCEDCGELIDEDAAAEAAFDRQADDGETFRGNEAASALAEEQAWIQRNLK